MGGGDGARAGVRKKTLFFLRDVLRDALQKVVYRNVPKSTRTVTAGNKVSATVTVNEGTQSGNSANNNMES